MISFDEGKGENRGHRDFNLQMVASAGPSPQELKRKVDKSKAKNIIYYRGNIFEIHYDELRNIGLDHYGDVVKRCSQKGLSDPVFFGSACHYCDNSSNTIFDIAMKTQSPVIIQDTSKVDWHCSYQPDPGIKVALPFTSRDGKHPPFYAISEKRCAFEDSLISYLAENGYLDFFKTDKNFNFRPISDFKENDKIPAEFLLRNVSPEFKKRGIFSKLFNFIRR